LEFLSPVVLGDVEFGCARNLSRRLGGSFASRGSARRIRRSSVQARTVRALILSVILTRRRATNRGMRRTAVLRSAGRRSLLRTALLRTARSMSSRSRRTPLGIPLRRRATFRCALVPRRVRSRCLRRGPALCLRSLRRTALLTRVGCVTRSARRVGGGTAVVSLACVVARGALRVAMLGSRRRSRGLIGRVARASIRFEHGQHSSLCARARRRWPLVSRDLRPSRPLGARYPSRR